MKSTEEELYYACMSFCESFFHFMCEENKDYNRKMFGYGLYDEDTCQRIMEFERERVFSKFLRLKEVVLKMDNECFGKEK